MSTILFSCALLMISVQVAHQEPEAKSLSGKPLYAPRLSDESRKKLEADLAKARAIYSERPESADAAVWVGRRLAYLGRFRESIKWYTESLAKHGPSAKLLRHRGHRYITTRKFDEAIQDFEKAAELIKGTKDEVEPDGVPNSKNQPISSLHSNIWYHLALARYLKGDYQYALVACDEGLKVSGNPDRLVSQTYWRYLILRRLGKNEEAKRALEQIHKDLDLIENHAYLRLLLVFKGEITSEVALAKATAGNDEPTTAFGLGAYYLAEGDKERAGELFKRAVSGPNWPAFGFIAAEAELQRL